MQFIVLNLFIIDCSRSDKKLLIWNELNNTLIIQCGQVTCHCSIFSTCTFEFYLLLFFIYVLFYALFFNISFTAFSDFLAFILESNTLACICNCYFIFSLILFAFISSISFFAYSFTMYSMSNSRRSEAASDT